MRKNGATLRAGWFVGNAHSIKGAVNEEERDHKKECADSPLHVAVGHRHRDLDRKEAEERCEFDHRVQRHGRSVLERITNSVANHSGRVKGSALLAEIHLDDFLGVVPRTASVRHEDGLEQSKEGDADEIANEEIGIKKWQRK